MPSMFSDLAEITGHRAPIVRFVSARQRMLDEQFERFMAGKDGVRDLHGRDYTFDADRLSDNLAILAKIDAPDDLSGLSDDALAGLSYRAIRLAALSEHRDLDLFERVSVERQARKGRAA